MKIGFLISSLTQSIPYMTYLISVGYEVIPIILQQEPINNDEKKHYMDLKKLIEIVVERPILDNNNIQEIEKLDCLLIMSTSEKIYSLKNINYQYLLKEHAPIIFEISNSKELTDVSDIIPYNNVYIIDSQSKNTIDQCNKLVSGLTKILTKTK